MGKKVLFIGLILIISSLSTFPQVQFNQRESGKAFRPKLLEPGLSVSSSYPNIRITINSASSKNPRIACDNNYCYLVWQDNRDGNEEIYWCKVNHSGQIVASERNISQSPGSNSVVPDVSVDTSGYSYLVWQEGTQWGCIRFMRLDPLGSKTDSASFCESPLYLNPSIATNKAGESYIAYERRMPSIHYLTARKLSNSGTILCTQDFSNWDILDTYKYPNVSLNTDGTANVVWRDSWTDFTYRIFMAVINANCAKTGPYNICTSNNVYYPACSFLGPFFGTILYEMNGGIQNTLDLNCVRCQLANGYRPSVDNNGLSDGWFSAWHNLVAGKNKVFMTRFNLCPSDWGDVQVSDGAGNSEFPDIAVKKGGGDNWFAVWQDDRDGNFEIYFSGATIPSTGDVSGFVFDAPTSGGLGGVLVEFTQNDTILYSATTDITGLYEMFGVTAGFYTVRYSKPGYVTQAIERQVTAGWNIYPTVNLVGIDTDGDGLTDNWEVSGFDYDHDGNIDVDLPAMGADPLHKDIFVEIDWMEASEFETESHKPCINGLDSVIASFARAPVKNPDSSMGINLHIDYGQGGLFTGGNSVPHDSDLNPVWNKFDNLKQANFATARHRIFHYCIFAHKFDNTNSSGVSRNPNNNFFGGASDFLVTLLGVKCDSALWVIRQAGTFMHELGHNLGLAHGGGDHINLKPNYLSVMNYAFQFFGLRYKGWDGLLDYSRFTLPDLDENNLDENVGLNGGPALSGYGTRFNPQEGICQLRHCLDEKTVNDANGFIDWNQNKGDPESGVSSNINGGRCILLFCLNPKDTLKSFNDWDSLIFMGGSIGASGVPAESLPMETEWDTLEITNDEIQLLCEAKAGDANLDGNVNLSDIIYKVNYIFKGGPAPYHMCAGDDNVDRKVNLLDIIYAVNYVFKGGPSPIKSGVCCL